MTRNEDRLEKDLARVEGRFDVALEDIKILMNGMALQLNDLRIQRESQEGVNNRGSILGQPVGLQGETMGVGMNDHSFRYATKLEFPKFNGEGVDEWFFEGRTIFCIGENYKAVQDSNGVITP